MTAASRAAPEGPGNGAAKVADLPAPDNPRLRLRRNPLRLLVSAGLWAAAWYLLSYLVVGAALFAAGFTAATVAAALAVTLAGLPLLVAAAGVLRGCANAERGRLGLVLAEPVRGRYRTAPTAGIITQVRTRWRDPATWRDVAYIIGMWVPLSILDLVVVTIWLTFLAGITAPAWYWSIPESFPGGVHTHGLQLGYFPHGPHGPGGVGLFVDSLPRALATAAVCFVAFLLFNYVLIAAARAHAFAARSLLRPPTDPLAEAREVLTGPGPLAPLKPTMPSGTAQAHHQL